MNYKWDDSLSVGYAPIDTQHRRLFSINASITRQLEQEGGPTEKQLRKDIGDLIAYVRTHFDDEEKLLAQAKYPDIGSHVKLHEDFMYEVHELNKYIDYDELQKVASLLPQLVGKWLTNHIAVEDQKYVKYVKALALPDAG